MKQYILALSFFLYGISSFSQEAVGIELEAIRESRDSLSILYHLKTGHKNIPSGKGLHIKIGLEAGDSAVALPNVVLLGNNKRKVLDRYINNNNKDIIIPQVEADFSATYEYSIPYHSWMDSARIYVIQEVSLYRGKKITTSYNMGSKINLADHLQKYQADPLVAYDFPEMEEKLRSRQGRAMLDFPRGSSIINPNYNNNKSELDDINDALMVVMNDPDASFLDIALTGYSSPDGPYDSNDRLSRGRTLALQDYLQKKYDLPFKHFWVSSVAEDWDGLQLLVEESNIQHKQEILDIIASVDVFKGREGVLMNLAGGDPYREMLAEMFPKLRRVDYKINYSIKDYSLAETEVIIKSSPDNLSHFEMFALASSFDADSDEFKNIMGDLIPRYFADDAIANNNRAAMLLKSGNFSLARVYLEKAGQSAAALNNWGVYYLLIDDYEQSEQYLIKAQEACSKEAGHNLLELENKVKNDIKK